MKTMSNLVLLLQRRSMEDPPRLPCQLKPQLQKTAVLTYPPQRNVEQRPVIPRYKISLPLVNLFRHGRVGIPILGSRKVLQQFLVESLVRLQHYALGWQMLKRKS